MVLTAEQRARRERRLLREAAQSNGVTESNGLGQVRKAGGLEIKSAADMKMETISLIISAKWGTGKTTLAATVLDWPSIKKPKIFDIDSEGGLRPVRSRGSAIEYVSVASWQDVKNVVEWLGKGNAADYGALMVDNASEIADLAMEVTLEETGSEEPEWGDWRVNSRRVSTDLFRAVRNIGRKYQIPVIFTLWDREEYAPRAKGDNSPPVVRGVHTDLNPALRKLAHAAVDLVCWEEVLADGESRALHLKASKRTDSKSRLDRDLLVDKGVPAHLYDPSLVPLLDTLVNGLPWPDPNPHAVPEGMYARWNRPAEPKKEEVKRERPARPASRS